MARTVPGFDIRARGNTTRCRLCGRADHCTLVLVALLSVDWPGWRVPSRWRAVQLCDAGTCRPATATKAASRIAMLAGRTRWARWRRAPWRACWWGRQHEPRGGVPTHIADVIVATSLIAVLMAGLLTQYRVR